MTADAERSKQHRRRLGLIAVTVIVLVGVLIAAIVLGSRNLQNFDPALVIYTFAVVFAHACT